MQGFGVTVSRSTEIVGKPARRWTAACAMARQRLAADRMRLTVESALGDYLDENGDDYDD